LAPNGFVGAKAAIFETTHHLMAKTPVEEQNPTSTLLCGVMLFDHLGWKDSAELVTNSLIKTIADCVVTPDLARYVPNPRIVGGAEFCEAIVENFEEVRKSRVRQAMKRAASGAGLAL
jgi:isocitrate dehydrogenase